MVGSSSTATDQRCNDATIDKLAQRLVGIHIERHHLA